MNTKTKFTLFQLRSKQPFRVAKGRSKWYFYEFGDYGNWNLREILNDEIVIEFDNDDRNLTWTAINFTAINLYRDKLEFEIWDHKGKSPHLHIRNLPISHLPKNKLRNFKKFFIKKYVPETYIEFVDLSLCGIHLIALEWTNHWKGKYDVKRLLSKFEPNGM